MKSLVMIPQGAFSKRREIIEVISSMGSLVFNKKIGHDSLSEIKDFFKAIFSLTTDKTNDQTSLYHLKSNRSFFEFVLCNLSKSNIDKITNKNSDLFKIFHKDTFKLSDLVIGNLAIVLFDNVEELAGKLFWKICINPKLFKTNNKKLFDSLYFPTLLAKDGDGIFFDERIINRLEKLKIITKDDEVISIEDKGGWETLHNLTAEIEIKIRLHSNYSTMSLYGEALVPGPPMSADFLCDIILARRQFLAKFGILTSILEAEKGVVYSKGKNIPIKEYLQHTEDKRYESILAQISELAAIVDNRFFVDETGIGELVDTRIFEDYLEIADLNWSVFPDFIEVLETDKDHVFWRDLTRALNMYGNPQDSNSSLNQVLSCTKKEHHNLVNSVYAAVKNMQLTDWIKAITKNKQP